jgi:hypothetical protein
LDFKQLVDSFFIAERIHDREIDGAAEVSQIGSSHVFNALFAFD